MKFREHRGSLADSLATQVDLPPGMNSLLTYLRKLTEPWPTFPRIDRDTITIHSAGYDHRTNGNVYLVTLADYGVIGMIDCGPGEDPI